MGYQLYGKCLTVQFSPSWTECGTPNHRLYSDSSEALGGYCNIIWDVSLQPQCDSYHSRS